MTQVIGHRGAPRAERENTVAAFRAATGQGADGVEMDVRRTADDALVVHHDARLAGGEAIVALTWAELPDPIPDLATAVGACAGLGTVNVEVKNSPGDVDFDPGLGIADRVADVLLARPATDRAALLVSCFHLPTLARLRARAPGIATGWLVVGPPAVPLRARAITESGEWIAATVAAVIDGGHQALHPHHASVGPELVAAAHEAGLAVRAWTADDPGRIAWLAGIGVDAVITNVPDVALAALGR